MCDFIKTDDNKTLEVQVIYDFGGATIKVNIGLLDVIVLIINT